MPAEIGLIGTGLLGSAVAQRWLKAGYRVTAFDVDAAACARIQAAGATVPGSADELWQRCELVALVLPNSDVSRNVVASAQPQPGAIVMDMTTGDPDEMSRLAAECAARGIAYLDTTVGGSSAQALSGESIVMAGGDALAFEKCRELLACFACKLFYLGAPGNGARMKLALNLVLGLNRAVLAEGLGFAEACGLELDTVLEVFRSGPAYSKAMDVKGEKMLRGDFRPQARLSQHRKDVDLILRQATAHSARVPFSELHLTLLRELEENGYGAEDNSAVIRAFRK